MTETATNINSFLHDNLYATVQEIAEQFDLEEGEVVQILDSHIVDDDGNVEEVGPGQGGGWAPARAADAQEKQRHIELIDDQIKEREDLISVISDNAEGKETKKAIKAMIDELKLRREELVA